MELSKGVEIHYGDSLEVMARLAPLSVDLIAADLPYGSTACAWDAVIPVAPMWTAYERLLRVDRAVVLTATNPFAAMLIASNPKSYRYDWVWRKSKITNVLNAKKMPVRNHELVLVFGKGTLPYYPQRLRRAKIHTRQGSASDVYGIRSVDAYTRDATGYPRSVLEIASVGNTIHPTQKPVELMEYLVRTYTQPGDVVLDNTMGSGTTGIACINTGRGFIGIEDNPAIYKTAKRRLERRLLEVEAHRERDQAANLFSS